MEFAGTTRFSLLTQLGEGGMGVVYEAYDHRRDMRVALKVLRHVGPAHLYCFKREFRTLRDLSHPNIVALYELLSDGGYWFLTMELVEGPDFLAYLQPESQAGAEPSLDDMATRTGVFALELATREQLLVRNPPEDALPRAQPPRCMDEVVDEARLRLVLGQLAGALEALHLRGLVHRDLKPANVRVTKDDRVVLMDFGIAAEVNQPPAPGMEGMVLGTPWYMAPEQVSGGTVTAAADWYALGSMLYRALTGRLPFEGGPHTVMHAKKGLDPLPPSTFVTDVPEDLEWLCLALMDRDPTRRPTGGQVLDLVGVAKAASVHRRAPTNRSISGLVGRQHELGVLWDAYREVAGGGAACVLIQGSSGMGKTHLVEHFSAELQNDLTEQPLFLSGRCHERESLSYKAFDGVIDGMNQHLARLGKGRRDALLSPDMGVLARLFPMLLQVMSNASTGSLEGRDLVDLRAQAIEALRALFIKLAREGPVVVTIEDLHWADRDSLDMLLCLVREPAPRGLLVLATLRTESLQSGENPRLVEAANALAAHPESRILTIGPLSEKEQRDLVGNLSERRQVPVRLDERLHGELGGHPLLIVEVLRYLQDESETVQAPGELRLNDVLMRRVGRLPAQAQILMNLIALAGEPMPLRVLLMAAGLADADGERAASTLCMAHLARVSKVDQEPWLDSFNDHVRAALVSRLPSERMRIMHRHLAEALEGRWGAPLTALARHWLAVGERQRAALYFLEAGQAAAHQLAFDHASELFRSGLELVPEATGDSRLEGARCWALIGLALEKRLQGEDGEALEILARAQSIAVSHELTEQLATLYYWRGTLLFGRGAQGPCLDAYEMSLLYAAQTGSYASEAYALGGLGNAHYMLGHMSTACGYYERCIARCEEEGFLGILATNLPMHGMTRLYHNDLEAALRDGREALRVAEGLGHVRAELLARSSCISWTLIEMGQLGEARAECEYVLRRSAGPLVRRLESLALIGLTRILAYEQRFAEAHVMARRSLALCRRTGMSFLGPVALGVLAWVSDDAGERRSALDEAQALMQGDTLAHNALYFYRYAMEMALSHHRPEDVEQYAAALAACTAAEPLQWCEFYAARGRVLARYLQGDPDRPAMAREARRLLDQARRSGMHLAASALESVLHTP